MPNCSLCNTCPLKIHIRPSPANKLTWYCMRCDNYEAQPPVPIEFEEFYFKTETRVIMRNLCPSKYCNNVNCGMIHNDERNHDVRMIASRKGWRCWCCWKCYKESNTVIDCGCKKNATDYKITNRFRYN